MEHEQKAPDEEKTERMPLDRGYAWVLVRHEIARGIGEAQRLGLAPGDLLPAGGPPRIEATGTSFRKKLASIQPSRRGAVAVPPSKPNLPAVPDAYRLLALLEDHNNHLETTSVHERCFCEAHTWLVTELKEGRVPAWADMYIRSPKSEEISIGRGIVTSKTWKDGDFEVDYRDASAVSRRDDWEAQARDGYRRRGQLVLENIAVGSADLGRQLMGSGQAPGQRPWPMPA
jgi:hypothetical protein